MALEHKFNFDVQKISRVNGATFSSDNESRSKLCYIKVSEISGNKEEIMFNVLFKSSEFSLHKSYSMIPDLEGPNFIKQAYLYLKSLPEFEGAVDC